MFRRTYNLIRKTILGGWFVDKEYKCRNKLPLKDIVIAQARHTLSYVIQDGLSYVCVL